MPGETILVIDDSTATREFVVDYVLKPNGYVPLTARDGEEGLRVALDKRPDLIILDFEMPRLSGLEVLAQLRHKAVSIPIILSTAHGSEAIAIEVFRLGVRDYVVKPYEVADMVNAIERALSETRAKRERDELVTQLTLANRSLEARLRELSALYSISKSVTTLLDHDTLLKRVVEAAQFVTSAPACLLRLHDRTTGQLRIQAAIGAPNTITDRLTQHIAHSGQAAITPHAAGVPLKVGDKFIGTLDISNDEGARLFTDHDVHLLQALADYAAIAIENARLFSELEDSKEREKQAIRTIFERYVTPAVVEQLLSHPENAALGGGRRSITALFADIRGFTSLAEHLKPEVLFEALNQHLALGADAVLSHEGTLDKFMGDSIMAFFNAPVPQDDYALRAVRAAIDLQQRMVAANQTAPANLKLQFGVGIATGDAVVGNIGTARMMNYTAIGHTVNLARRLQEVAKGGQILLDQATQQAVTGSIKTRSLGAMEIKGFSAPVAVYQVIGFK